ncbi:Possible hemagglutinin, partial [Humidesulfovibrio mexicanus]
LAKIDGLKDAVKAGDWAGKAAQDTLVTGTVQAGVGTALYGGDLGQNLLDGLRGAAVDALGAKAANEIGAAAKAGDLDYVTHKIAHAALGGAMAAADGKDAASGALGGVVGEVAAQAFLTEKLKTGISEKDMPALEELGINYGKLAAGLVAALSGADVGTASMTADNAVRNNWAESAWDALFVLYDLGKIQYGRYIDDKGMVQEGFIDLAADSTALLIPMVPAGMTKLARAGEKAVASTVSREIKLVDGFYEAEGSAFKFSKYYYERLGIPKEVGKSPRLATPFLAAEEVYKTSGPIVKDFKPGFYKYDNGVMEMIYNPKTKEVWHLQHKSGR